MLLKKRNSIIFLLSLFAITGLCAQNRGTSPSSSSVSSAGSDSFVIASNGRQQTYQTGTIPVNGLELQNSDMIQTGPNNYVEIQLDPSGAIVKLAENTSVIFNDLGSTNRSAMLSLLYGRMRIVNSSNGGAVTIQIGNASVEFARGDLALEFAVIPGAASTQPQLQVSTLSGTIQVSSGTMANAAKITCYEHETVTFEVTSRLTMLSRQSLNQETVAYWSRNAFRQAGMSPQSTYLAQGGGQSPLPAIGAYPAGINPAPVYPNNSVQSASTGSDSFPKATPAVPVTPKTSTTTNVERMSDMYATISVKNGGVFWGTIITAAGILMQNLAHFDVLGLDDDLNDRVHTIGFIPIATGIITLVATYSYLYNNSQQR
ncbi:MAG: FecR domain-containing protein [Spirochaetaceae bacterium]|jgi:hypothetical protein|nr:FecR domain-containing protein [Spirochaetaceae bacterium]